MTWSHYSIRSRELLVLVICIPSVKNNGSEVCVRTHLHCNENPIYLFHIWELCGLSPNFHIHVSVSDLYMYAQDQSTFFACSIIDRQILEIYKSVTDIGV
jgi:hypothetical protein